MFKDEILENDNRKKIYETIERSPGIHLRELQRILDMPLTTLEYHLSYMVRKKIIYSETDTHYKRYYAKPIVEEDKKVLSALRQKRLREVVLLILSHGKAKYQFMADYLKIPHSTLSFYLKYLVDNGILVKDKVGYEINFTKYFYQYTPLEPLEQIKADILRLEKETEGLLQEILG